MIARILKIVYNNISSRFERLNYKNCVIEAINLVEHSLFN